MTAFHFTTTTNNNNIGNSNAYYNNNNNNSFRSTNQERQSKIQQIALDISRRLNTNLSDTAVEAIVDLLQAGVAPDSVLAILEHLHQVQRDEQQQQRHEGGGDRQTERMR